MENRNVISLLGCGWLGLPLAKSLILDGFKVRASTTTSLKIDDFKEAGIDPYLVQFSSSVQLPDLKKLFEANTLIITIPPGRRDPDGFSNYKAMVRAVLNAIPKSTVSKIIFISSTSVYADCNSNVDEFSEVNPDTDSGRLLAETEEELKTLPVKLISLRLAGLVGPGRMPGRFFAGKTNIPNGLAPINLIHQIDVIEIIKKLLADNHAEGIFNGCAPSHPTKEEFYTLAAQMQGLEKPQFIQEKLKWKLVSANRLDYSFKIGSLMDWIINT